MTYQGLQPKSKSFLLCSTTSLNNTLHKGDQGRYDWTWSPDDSKIWNDLVGISFVLIGVNVKTRHCSWCSPPFANTHLSSLYFSKEQFHSLYTGCYLFLGCFSKSWLLLIHRVSNLMMSLQTSFSCFPVLLPSRHMEGLSFLGSLGLGTAMGTGLAHWQWTGVTCHFQVAVFSCRPSRVSCVPHNNQRYLR